MLPISISDNQGEWTVSGILSGATKRCISWLGTKQSEQQIIKTLGVVRVTDDGKKFYKPDVSNREWTVSGILSGATKRCISWLGTKQSDGAWTEYVSGGVTLLRISSTKQKERPLRFNKWKFSSCHILSPLEELRPQSSGRGKLRTSPGVPAHLDNRNTILL
nr:hypothetical protein [Tanacetum cinerariifolium]